MHSEGGCTGRKMRAQCGCPLCKQKHDMMFWTIVLLLLVIIALMLKQMRMV